MTLIIACFFAQNLPAKAVELMSNGFLLGWCQLQELFTSSHAPRGRLSSPFASIPNGRCGFGKARTKFSKKFPTAKLAVGKSAYRIFRKANVDDDHDSDPEVILLKSEEINSFAKIWDELDDKTKFLLSSRYILEKSYAEIASDLNVKPESARMALTRARRAALTLSKKSHT